MAIFSTIGSIISTNKQNKTARHVADISQQATDQNAALLRDIYGQNQQTLQPFVDSGNAAGGQLNALLGLSGDDAQANAESAFDTFRGGTNYQFRLNEGQEAVNSNYGGGGVALSGAAAKALQAHGQNTASNELGNYMGYLGNQQGVGLSGASALAGVSQNFANSNVANTNQGLSNVANANMAGSASSFGNALGNYGSVLQNILPSLAGGGL